MKICRIRVAILSLVWMLLGPAAAYAKGILPPTSNAPLPEPTTGQMPIVIGDKIPEGLRVRDADGTKRTLLSYKSSVEVMVIEFLSPRCAANASLWPQLRRFYEAYKDWRVSFVAVCAAPGRAPELQKTLRQAGLRFSAAEDIDGKATRLLQIKGTPDILIVDEFGVLRYRGPYSDSTKKALDTVISHIDPVTDPEPAGSFGCPLQ